MKSSIKRLGLAAIMTISALSIFLFPFSADAVTLSASTASAKNGQVFSVSGICGTTAGSTVSFSLIPALVGATSLGTTTTVASGSYSAFLTVPASFPTGAAVLSATCSADSSIAYANMNIDPAATVPSGGVAAGQNNRFLIWSLGLLMAVLGGIGLVWPKIKQAYA